MTPRRAPPPRTRPKGRRGVPSGVRGVPPSAVIRTYDRALQAWNDHLTEAFAGVFRSVGVPSGATRSNAAADGAGPSSEEIVRAFDVRQAHARLAKILRGFLLSTRAVHNILDVVDSRVKIHTKAQWEAQLEHLGVKLDDVAVPHLSALRSLWRDHNIKLITDHAEERAERVRSILDSAPGERVETIARRIEQETRVSKSKAALLARDQTLKLYAQQMQQRHQAAGVMEYVWRTSLDERVRAAHKSLDGTRQRYLSPPIVDAKRGRREHPGGDYQCRCTADPILPGLDALTAPPATPRAA